MAPRLEAFAVPGLPMVQPEANVATLINEALERNGQTLADGDVVCIAQKIVSKAENRQVALASVEPGAEACELAQAVDKDPRLVQLILDESTEVLRHKPGVLIVRHRLGIVGANAGIDQSNIDHGEAEEALLLPIDPDGSAASIRADLEASHGCRLAVMITDSHNRPWRLGTVGACIGCAGLAPLDDHRGGTDLYGRELKVTLINRADAIASIATLLMGETTEQLPVAVVRGLGPETAPAPATTIVRPPAEDLFR
ncbi:MAG: coenzyme F420-0:L-glutamate ligase [Pseudomonadota bacterium]